MKNETARREIESLDYYLQNHTNDYSEESHTAMMMAIKALEQTRTKGTWIFHKPFDNGRKNCNECIECSQCHIWLNYDFYAKTPYCPNCGADMREGETDAG